jgi:thermitase
VHYVLKLLVLLGLLLLAACSHAPLPPATEGSNVTSVATVAIKSTDTEASLEAQYGGKVVLFSSEAGLAMLEFTGSDFTALTTMTNQGAFGTPEVTAAGSNAWGGGSNAWGGGKSAWGGGWNAWGGGWKAWSSSTSSATSLPVLPSENRAKWRDIKLPQAQAISKNYGAGIKVAVLDTGIDLNHPVFSGRLAPSAEWKDFIDNDATPQEVSGSSYGHGTAVAGIVLQVAPRATILPIRVLNGEGVGDTDDIASAINWAVQKGAKVINLSLGTNVQATALQSWVGYALSQGVYVVASSGNSGDGNITYPAADALTITYGGVNRSQYLLSVGSVNNSGSRSSFSTYGTALKLLAPGEQVFTAFPNNQVGHATGTSFAAPQVSGLVALALADTALTYRGNLQTYLSQSAVGLGTGNGYGLVNAVGMMTRLPDLVRKQVLMVVWDATPLDPADAVLRNRLQNLGYSVTLKDAFWASAGDAVGKDIVVITGTADSYWLGDKFRNVTVPVLVSQNDANHDMGLTSSAWGTDFYSTNNQSATAISNSAHPLAAGYSGSQTLYTSGFWMNWGVPNSNAVKVATLTGNSSRATIFAYDKGVGMVGLTAPARRVGFFLDDDAARIMTNQAGFLFDAAVTWAVTGN